MEYLQLSLDLSDATPIDLDDVEELEEVLADDTSTDELACGVCNGSGEGAYGGSCYACHGTGSHNSRAFYN